MSRLPPSPAEMPLPFGNHRARVELDPDRLAEQVKRAVALRDLSPRSTAVPFVHRSVHLQVGPLSITAAAHAPLQGANHAHHKAVFTLPTLGEKRFRIGSRSLTARAGHSALFLPGEAYSLHTTGCSGVMFSLCPKDLAAVASTMAGPRCCTNFLPVEQPVEFLESHPQQGKLLSLLRRSLHLIDLASRNGPSVPSRLGLEDKLTRLMALLVYPQLMAPPAPASGSMGTRERAALDALVAAIREDPPGPWTLTRMEQQAGLSRLQLHQLFESSFACAPMDWLRHQRLCWARRRLDAPEPVSLHELALQCGYADLQRFRQHFEGQFQIAPETLHPDLH